jgi:hypothetical protein
MDTSWELNGNIVGIIWKFNIGELYWTIFGTTTNIPLDCNRKIKRVAPAYTDIVPTNLPP